MRGRTLSKVWQILTGNTMSAKLMREKWQMAQQQSYFNLKQKTFAGLCYHHDLMVKAKVISYNRQR